MRAAALVALFLLGCEQETYEQIQRRQTIEAWNAACADESYLLATTSGSPSGHRCPNKRHRMRVQVATHPSNEEAAALVFCECRRGDGGPP